jgi:dynein heavy chain 1
MSLLCYTEDVGDEGEEEKESIAYNISIDIHYGIKSNR